MGLFGLNKKNGGLVDEIRCDESSYLIWKWHPKDSKIGENNRENSIRWGSPLRVKDGEVAIFVYKQKNGTIQDFILGPFDENIKTLNFPILASILGLAYDGGTPFQAEVYFINLAQIIQIRFAVPFFDVYDPRFLDFGVPIAVRGTISFNINNYKEFIKLHRLNNFSLEDFKSQVRDAISRYTKDCVANTPTVSNIPVIQIESKIGQINDTIEFDIKERFAETFGINVSGVDISAIEIDKSSESYLKLMSITEGVTISKITADTLNYKENLRIQREEGQYALHKQTQTSNIAAFTIEKQAEVGVAGAEALGQMGSNNAGGIDLGSGCGNDTGFNPVAMMAGMTLGGAVGQNIVSTMNGVVHENSQTIANIQLPQIPKVVYHVAINGQVTGPFDIATLMQMTASGYLKKDSLVWKQGMSEWAKVETLDELMKLFNGIPPNPPTE